MARKLRAKAPVCDEFYCKAAKTVDEATKLIEAGFE